MTERRPRIGILGIMQDLYDDMIPGIAQRQEGYAAELAASLAAVGDFVPGKPVKYREDAERAMREFEDSDLDGVLVVMLTYGPAMRVARLLAQSRLPVCLANIQPEPAVTAIIRPTAGHAGLSLSPIDLGGCPEVYMPAGPHPVRPRRGYG